MARAFEKTLNLFNDADYFFTAAQLAGAGAITLLATAAGPFAPQRVVIASVGDDTGVDFTITGLDQNGVSQSEVLDGVSGGTATSAKYYTSITSIVSDGATAGNITIGLDGLAVFMMPVDAYAAGHMVAVSLVSGSGTFSVSHGYVNPLKTGFVWTDQKWITASGMTDKTASTDLYYTGGVWAFKIAFSVAGAGADVFKLTVLKVRPGY